MGTLQTTFNRVIKELCTVESLRIKLLRRVAKARNLELTEQQFEILSNSIGHNSAADVVTVELDGLTEEVVITSSDLEMALKLLEDDIGDHIERCIQSALDELPTDILQSLYDDLPEALQHRRGNHEEFQGRLYLRWKDGLDRLEMLIMIAQESGDSHLKDVNLNHSEDEINSASNDDAHMLEALVALHVRSCRIASEVLCLLRGGYADGANARWRSLHEVAVTAMFLTEHPGDTVRRFLDHAAVERSHAAEKYQEHCHTLGYEPFSEEELTELRQKAQAVIDRYGKSFRKDCGWAADAIGDADPTFAKIEAALQMAHWRPYYKLACQSVHAGAQSLHHCLSLPTCAEHMLIPGATDAGLAQPGHNAAISLTMASVALFTFQPSIDSLIICKCMQQICDDIENALFTADEQLEREILSSA